MVLEFWSTLELKNRLLHITHSGHGGALWDPKGGLQAQLGPQYGPHHMWMAAPEILNIYNDLFGNKFLGCYK